MSATRQPSVGKSRSPAGLVVLGISFRTAPVDLRERLAFRPDDLPRALAEALRVDGCREAAILSTCNRVELYAAGDESASLCTGLRAFLSRFHGVAENEFRTGLFEHCGQAALQHLFEVTASIDSQILGETEILAQAREAYRSASQAGSAGPVLRAAFERAFKLSKDIRTEGGIGRAHASVSAAAVQLGEKIFEHLRGHKVLVVGTGVMAAGMVRTLRAAGVQGFTVLSRTRERADAFAREEGGSSGHIDELVEHLRSADIVLVSTASPHYVIRPDHIHGLDRFRHGKPLFVIDISVPRNVDPEIHKIDDCFLYDIDDLEEVAKDGRRQREQVAERWRPRLEAEAAAVLNSLVDTSSQDTARALVAWAKDLRERELAALAANSQLDEAALATLAQAMERAHNKLLHAPLAALKEAQRNGDGQHTARWVARLFHLMPDELEVPDSSALMPQVEARPEARTAAEEPQDGPADTAQPNIDRSDRSTSDSPARRAPAAFKPKEA